MPIGWVAVCRILGLAKNIPGLAGEQTVDTLRPLPSAAPAEISPSGSPKGGKSDAFHAHAAPSCRSPPLPVDDSHAELFPGSSTALAIRRGLFTALSLMSSLTSAALPHGLAACTKQGNSTSTSTSSSSKNKYKGFVGAGAG
ncbi:hypothetical protein MMC11_000225 [Xylographa trunciseda]|nr:hypothetical protein [Xylographa trunciseda]